MPSGEVICLSSDDEEDLPMKNLVDCDSSPSKIQLTPSVQLIKRENSGTKRKISGDEITLKKLKVDSTETWIETAKTKNNDHLSTNSNNSTARVDSSSKSNFKNNVTNSTDKNDSTSVASTSNGHKHIKPFRVTTSEENSGDVKIPTLVVKTKQPVNVENGHENVFSMFIGQCLSRERTSDMHKVVEKLKRKYEQLDTAYANSEAFADLLNEKRHLLELEKGAVYMHIKDVLDEMKIRKAGRKSAVCKSEPDATDADANADAEEVDAAVEGMDEKEREHFRKQEMKIKRLEKTMELVQKRIKKYEAEEVDWNDEDDSMYMKLERYKKRMVELYNAWCKLTANHEDAGRSYLRPKHVKLTGIVTVDQAINSFVNSRLKKRSSLSNQGGKDDFFPDYVDILNLIHTHNVNHNLGMSKIRESAAAKSAFVKLGEYLKSERQQDFYDTFSMWYENDEDPAQKDPELLSKLQENREHGEKKLNEVFDEYTRKQEELNASGKSEEVKGTDDEDEDEDEEDEERDEGDDERDVSDAEVVDLESDNSAAEDADADKENGDKNTNGKDKSSDKVAEEPEIVETAETIWLESKTDKVLSCDSGKIKKNLPSTSKQSASTSTSFNNSDNKSYKSKVDNTDDDAHEDCDDKADDKPVLKLRSFAKPPEFWANSQEIKESDWEEEPAPRVQGGNDSSIEVIHIDISGDKSPKTARTVAPNQTVQPTPANTTKKILYTRMVPVPTSRLCRLSTGDPVLKSPVATSTPNLNSNSNPNRHPRAGDSTPKRPVEAPMPNRPIQASNTASPAGPGAGPGAGPQRKELKPVTFFRNNNQNNVPVGQPTEQTATSSSVTNGRVAPTVTSLQTFRKTDVKKLQRANSKNIFNNDLNSNYNLNSITSNSNSTSNNNSNPRNNVGNKSGTSGQRQVINPMAARKIVDRPINRTDVNVNNLNRLTPRNGQMS